MGIAILYLRLFLSSLVGFVTSSLFIYFSFISAWGYKIIYLLIFTISIFHEYSYQNVFSRFSNFKDIHIALTTTPEQKAYALFTYFSFLALIPCTFYLLMLLMVKSKLSNHKLKSIFFVIVLFFSFYSYLSIKLQQNNIFLLPTASTGAFTRTAISFLYFRYNTFYKPKRETVTQPSLSDSYHPTNNIVFIVDESIR